MRFIGFENGDKSGLFGGIRDKAEDKGQVEDMVEQGEELLMRWARRFR